MMADREQSITNRVMESFLRDTMPVQNIAQRLTEALLNYAETQTDVDKFKTPEEEARDNLLANLVTAVVELDARTAHVQRGS